MSRLGLAMYLFDKEIIDKRHEGQKSIDPALKEILDTHFGSHINKVIHWHEDVRGAFAISLPMFWWWVLGFFSYSGVEAILRNFGVEVGKFPSQIVMGPAGIVWIISVIVLCKFFMAIRQRMISVAGKKITALIDRVPQGKEAYQALIAGEPNGEYRQLLQSFIPTSPKHSDESSRIS